MSLQEFWVNPSVRKVLDLSEEEKLQAATDVVEAVYFLHSQQNVSFQVSRKSCELLKSRA